MDNQKTKLSWNENSSYFPNTLAFQGYHYFRKAGFWTRRLGDLMTCSLLLTAFLSALWLGFENLFYLVPGISILIYLAVELRRFFKPKMLVYKIHEDNIFKITCLIEEKTVWIADNQHNQVINVN